MGVRDCPFPCVSPLPHRHHGDILETAIVLVRVEATYPGFLCPHSNACGLPHSTTILIIWHSWLFSCAGLHFEHSNIRSQPLSFTDSFPITVPRAKRLQSSSNTPRLSCAPVTAYLRFSQSVARFPLDTILSAKPDDYKRARHASLRTALTTPNRVSIAFRCQ
jgi:hypothetical protein